MTGCCRRGCAGIPERDRRQSAPRSGVASALVPARRPDPRTPEAPGEVTIARTVPVAAENYVGAQLTHCSRMPRRGGLLLATQTRMTDASDLSSDRHGGTGLPEYLKGKQAKYWHLIGAADAGD